MIHLTIDGRPTEVPEGSLVLDAARGMGIDIPTFCYHHLMKPAAACRMCLVDVEGRRKLEPACALTASEGMVVNTQASRAVEARKSVLEFILLQHPLDCPVCDKGGECDLQDHTFAYAAHATRYRDPKLHKEKAKPLSDLVVLDEERCIMCMRCVRFMNEVAEDPQLTLRQRGAVTVVDTFPDKPFTSVFSGNTIEMCPVGALTSRQYRFKSRPWDTHSAPSICTHCALGCNLVVQARDGELVRTLSRENPEVDAGWLCDRGRFGYRYVHHEQRITEPTMQLPDGPAVLDWEDAVERAHDSIRAAGARSALLGGGKLSAEAQLALAELMRALHSPWVDHLTGALRYPTPPGPRAKIADLDKADRILVLGADPRRATPVMELRIYRAMRQDTRLLVMSDRHTFLARAHRQDVFAPGEGEAAVRKLASAVTQGSAEDMATDLLSGERIVIVWDGETAPQALAELTAALGERLVGTLIAGGEAGTQGAERAGLFAGHSTREILEAAERGDIDLLLLADEGFVEHYPDPDLVRQALAKVPVIIALGMFPTEAMKFAHLILPLAAVPESEGHLVNLEGRVQPYEKLIPPPGEARADWEVASLLAGMEPDAAALIARYEARPEPAPRPVNADDVLAVAPALDGRVQVISGPIVFGSDVIWEPGLASRMPAPTLSLHPADLAALGLHAEQRVVIGSDIGSAEVDLAVDPELPPGVAMVPRGVGDLTRFVHQAVSVRAAELQVKEA